MAEKSQFSVNLKVNVYWFRVKRLEMLPFHWMSFWKITGSMIQCSCLNKWPRKLSPLMMTPIRIWVMLSKKFHFWSHYIQNLRKLSLKNSNLKRESAREALTLRLSLHLLGSCLLLWKMRHWKGLWNFCPTLVWWPISFAQCFSLHGTTWNLKA